MKCRYYFA